MANDILQLMRQLGHEQFAVVGHDRGSHVAMRPGLDAPQAVTRLAVLDSVPIAEALDRTDARFAAAWWHWFFFAQPDKPERAIHDPATVHAMLEDYRAALGPDRAADEADRAASRRINCPTLALWTSRDDLADLHGDVLAIWQSWTTDLSGGPIDSAHHVAEDAPDELAARLSAFLAS